MSNEYIKEEILKIKSKQMEVEQVEEQEENSSFFSNILFACVVLGSMVTVMGVVTKVSWKQLKNAVDSKFDVSTEEIKEKNELKESYVETNKQITEEDVRKIVDEKLIGVDKRITDLESVFDKWSNRVWLLGIITNENAMLLKANHPNTDYIVLERDWKLSRMPKSITMQDQEKIQENIK